MLTPRIKSEKLAKKIGLNTDLYLKHEDLHPFGSHKGRSTPLMINKHHQAGWNNFVISSSGNSAIASAYAVQKHNLENPKQNLKLKIFVGKNIDKNKLKKITKLLDKNISLKQVDKPKQTAFKIDKDGEAKNLRQSTDDGAITGYYELATELAEIKNLSAVFIPTSSGTTAQGLHEGFKKLKLNPQIHIVQTTFCHPLVFNPQAEINLSLRGGASATTSQSRSLATAIVDKIAHRKQTITKILKNSRGNGWVADNKQITDVIELINKTEKLKVSPNSALSIVGLQQALQANKKFSGPVVCLITGE